MSLKKPSATADESVYLKREFYLSPLYFRLHLVLPIQLRQVILMRLRKSSVCQIAHARAISIMNCIINNVSHKVSTVKAVYNCDKELLSD